jgi:hypothetical protein
MAPARLTIDGAIAAAGLGRRLLLRLLHGTNYMQRSWMMGCPSVSNEMRNLASAPCRAPCIKNLRSHALRVLVNGIEFCVMGCCRATHTRVREDLGFRRVDPFCVDPPLMTKEPR